MKRGWRSFLKNLGPGFITGASDDDPSGIATYTQAGAGFGFGVMWLMLWALPFMIAIQEMCARIAMATGKGLIRNLEAHTSKRTATLIASILFIANTLNVGADLGMMASSIQLVLPIPFWPLLLGITIITLFLQVFLNYETYSKYLKWLCLSLFAYVAVSFVVGINWPQALWSTVIPQFQWTSEYWLIVIAILGTTISPYLYFWQCSQELEEQRACGCLVNDHDRNPTCDWKHSVKNRRTDVAIGMTFSNLIAWFILAVGASVLFTQGMTMIETADQAAHALQPFGGALSSWLFTIGIVGTGLLAVPVLTASGAFALSDALRWKNGLEKKWKDAKNFYGLIIFSTLIGALSNGLGIKPVTFLIYASVVNALVAPIMLLFIVRLADNGRVMGKFKNSRLSSMLGYAACLIMGAAAILWVIISLK